MNESGKFYLVLCNNDKVSVLTFSSIMKLQKATQSQKLSFIPIGLKSHKEKVLIYGNQDCMVIDRDMIGSETEDMICGFEGVVSCSSWISNHLIVIQTDKGLYLYNLLGNKNCPTFSVVLDDCQTCVAYFVDSVGETFFILNTEGMIKISRVVLNGKVRYSEMKDFEKECKDMGRLNSSLIKKTSHGLFKFDEENEKWNCLYLVKLSSNCMCDYY